MPVLALPEGLKHLNNIHRKATWALEIRLYLTRQQKVRAKKGAGAQRALSLFFGKCE